MGKCKYPLPADSMADAHMCNSKPVLINNLSILFIIIINCIFSYKYLVMFSYYPILVNVYNGSKFQIIIDLIKNNPIVSTLIYGFILLFSIIIVDKYASRIKQIKIRSFFLVMIFVYLVLNLSAILATDQKNITVDRWSVITSFWDAVSNETFPYLAKSHLGCYPGPSPFYFVIAYPFYLVGEIGYLSLTGCLLLFILIYNYYKSKTKQYIATALIILSTSVFWENMARSTVLTISTIIIIYMVIAIKNRSSSKFALVLLGAAGGLLYSTRSVYIIVYIICYGFLFLQGKKYRELFIISTSFSIAFLLTFLPFLIWDFQTFILYNPITLQASLAGYKAIAFVLILSVIAGFIVKTEQEVYFCSAILIILIVSFHMINGINIHGFDKALFESKVDISYFILALPFLLLSMKNDTTTAKVDS